MGWGHPHSWDIVAPKRRNPQAAAECGGRGDSGITGGVTAPRARTPEDLGVGKPSPSGSPGPLSAPCDGISREQSALATHTNQESQRFLTCPPEGHGAAPVQLQASAFVLGFALTPRASSRTPRPGHLYSPAMCPQTEEVGQGHLKSCSFSWASPTAWSMGWEREMLVDGVTGEGPEKEVRFLTAKPVRT